MRQLRLAASILNADLGQLTDQVQQVEAAGVDFIHVDVMDGHFVPNISFGFATLEAIRRATSLPLDVHLMIERPERFLAEFAAAGATYLTVHQEAVQHLQKALVEMRKLGLKAGLALCPATSLTVVEDVWRDLDLLLVMTINPGLGGQEIIPATIDKVARARELLDAHNPSALLEVDGGVKAHNAANLVRAGADTLVVGTGIFQAADGILAGVRTVRGAFASGT